MSDTYQSLVVYADGSWKNEIAYYNASDGTIKYYSDTEYSVDEIKEINNTVNLKMQMSALIIKNNYFNHLDAAKVKAQEEINNENNQVLANAE